MGEIGRSGSGRCTASPVPFARAARRAAAGAARGRARRPSSPGGPPGGRPPATAPAAPPARRRRAPAACRTGAAAGPDLLADAARGRVPAAGGAAVVRRRPAAGAVGRRARAGAPARGAGGAPVRPPRGRRRGARRAPALGAAGAAAPAGAAHPPRPGGHARPGAAARRARRRSSPRRRARPPTRRGRPSRRWCSRATRSGRSPSGTCPAGARSTPIAEIQRLNDLEGSVIHPGQRLVLPGAALRRATRRVDSVDSACVRVRGGIPSTPRCSSYMGVSRPQVGSQARSPTGSAHVIHSAVHRRRAALGSACPCGRAHDRGGGSAMRCPYCRHADSRVVDSREADDGQLIRRRRSCPECGKRFTTVEEAVLADRQAQRRHRAVQPHEDHVAGCARRARAGRSTTTRSRCWPRRSRSTIRARGTAEVPSHEVGLAILGPLRDLDEVAYLRFASVYRSFESLDDFETRDRRRCAARQTRRRGRAPARAPRPANGSVAHAAG